MFYEQAIVCDTLLGAAVTSIVQASSQVDRDIDPVIAKKLGCIVSDLIKVQLLIEEQIQDHERRTQ